MSEEDVVPGEPTRNALLGLTSLHQNLRLFDFGNVLVIHDFIEFGNVKIVSGGNCSYGEFVGRGMLTCAIQDENWKTPPPSLILRALREISYESRKGSLIIVPRNSKNLLTFGIALERARNDKLVVKMIEVNDSPDRSYRLTDEKYIFPGVLLLSKIAGAMSERNMKIYDIYDYCKQISDDITSAYLNLENSKRDKRLSMELDSIDPSLVLPANEYRTKSLLKNDTYKFYLLNILHLCEMDQVVKGKINLKYNDSVAVLVNNSGVLNRMQEHNLAKDITEVFSSQNIIIHRLYIGNFINPSKDVTVTVLKLRDASTLDYLDDPCQATGWKTVNQGMYVPLSTCNIIKGRLKRTGRLSPPLRGPQLSNRVANILLFTVQFACDALISCEKQLNLIDSERGSGDTGSRLKCVAQALLKRMRDNKLETKYPITFFESLSKILENTVGGTSGSIYSILFEAAANYFNELEDTTDVSPLDWATAASRAAAALKRYGAVEFGDDTMYDPIENFSTVLKLELEKGTDPLDAFNKAVELAEQTANMTKKKFKFPDSGAHAVGIWLRAACESVKLSLPMGALMDFEEDASKTDICDCPCKDVCSRVYVRSGRTSFP